MHCRRRCHRDTQTDESLLDDAVASNITGVNFAENTANSLGGAVMYRGVWAPRLSDTTFERNSVSKQAATDGSNTGWCLLLGTALSRRWYSVWPHPVTGTPRLCAVP
eukprot:359898-Chlamydomonas_euryale.AAC.1